MSKSVVIAFILSTVFVSLVYPADMSHTKNKFTSIIMDVADKHDVPPALIRAIIMVESTFNPKARSKRGAKGLMQLMPKTAKHMGVKNPFDPSQNIRGGVKYFRYLLDKFRGNTKLALAAYNAGAWNVIKHRGVPPFRATHIYIRRVLKYKKFYEGGDENG